MEIPVYACGALLHKGKLIFPMLWPVKPPVSLPPT
jgi:hypothetical protein